MTRDLLFQILKVYLEISLLLALAAGLLKLASSKLKHVHALRLAQALVLASVTLPFAAESLPKSTLARPAVQVWSRSGHARQIDDAWLQPFSKPNAGVAGIQAPALKLEWGALLACCAVLALLVSVKILMLARRVRALASLVSRLPLLRRLGSVEVRITEDDPVPFSTRLPGRAIVVIPSTWIGSEDFAIALRHELQHHRQGDTSWLYFQEILKALFFFNPAIHSIFSRVEELQEFACDEALLGRQRLSPHAYGRSLLRAAEAAVGFGVVRVGTASMAASSNRQILKRRVEMLFTRPSLKKSVLPAIALSIGSLLALASAAYAAKSAIQDRRVTMADAQELVSKMESGEIPINVNELVLARLNQFVGTPKGREFMRDGLRRMPLYQSMIERKAKEHRLPKDLIAAALFESGFDNSRISSVRAAGIWQFIPETARNYGLAVNEKRDERFDPELETEAAMKYLGDLHELFKDWRLAFMGYNLGEFRVQKQIDQLGTRDPWALERAFPLDRYLSGVTATLIILKNPSLVD